jgi:hypothetical protein
MPYIIIVALKDVLPKPPQRDFIMSKLVKNTKRAASSTGVIKGLLALYGVALVTQGVAGLYII